MPLAEMQAGHAPAVARLHANVLAGDFLPSLGEPFLRLFYRTALSKNLAFGFVFLEGGEPAGFVLGSQDTSRLFRGVIAAAGHSLAWAALPAMARRPALILKVAETFLYPSREAAVAEKAELLVIAVEAGRRGQGIGETLVQALNRVFCERGVDSYKVTVLQSNPGANRFYQRLGFRPAGEFRLYRQGWNLYVYPLGGVIA